MATRLACASRLRVLRRLWRPACMRRPEPLDSDLASSVIHTPKFSVRLVPATKRWLTALLPMTRA